jgi:DNA-binding protein HU-beta
VARSVALVKSPQRLGSAKPLEVFISYASDLEPESKSVADDVDRVSTLYGRQFGVALHAVLFQRDVVPISGTGDPQSEIGQATFFIGLMWGRYGTSTPRAKSGMQEEYDMALACLKSPGRKMSHVAYYFCTRKVDLRSIDVRQVTAVASFRDRVAKDGVYAEFRQRADLERRVREDLESMVLAWKKHREELDHRMNKRALANEVASKSGLSAKKSYKFITAFQSSVRDEMAHGHKVVLANFGTFGVRETKARRGVNPKTLKAITIPKKQAPFFKPGKALKDAIAKK